MNKIFKKDFTLSLIFIVCIFAFMLLFFLLPKSNYSSSEKRVLAELTLPSFEEIADGSFGKNFETYLSDHFPLRNTFVGINSYYSLLVGQNGENGIYYGKDGYLIRKSLYKDDTQLVKNLSFLSSFKRFASSLSSLDLSRLEISKRTRIMINMSVERAYIVGLTLFLVML